MSTKKKAGGQSGCGGKCAFSISPLRLGKALTAVALVQDRGETSRPRLRQFRVSALSPFTALLTLTLLHSRSIDGWRSVDWCRACFSRDYADDLERWRHTYGTASVEVARSDGLQGVTDADMIVEREMGEEMDLKRMLAAWHVGCLPARGSLDQPSPYTAELLTEEGVSAPFARTTSSLTAVQRVGRWKDAAYRVRRAAAAAAPSIRSAGCVSGSSRSTQTSLQPTPTSSDAANTRRLRSVWPIRRPSKRQAAMEARCRP